MAEKETAPAPAAAAHEPAAPKKSILPLIGLVLSAVNIGATAFVWVTVDHQAALIKEGGHGGGGGGGHEGGEGAEPQTMTLDPLVVNLDEPESTRYLKTSVEVELASKEALDTFTKSKSAVRDEALRYLSGLKVVDTQGEGAKKKIRDELAVRFDKLVGEGKVKRIFFSEFVVQ